MIEGTKPLASAFNNFGYKLSAVVAHGRTEVLYVWSSTSYFFQVLISTPEVSGPVAAGCGPLPGITFDLFRETLVS